MAYDPDIASHFKSTLRRDGEAGLVEEWMTVWHWKELAPQFGDSQDFLGAVELVNWVLAQSTCRNYPNDLAFAQVEELAQKVVDKDSEIFAQPVFTEYQNKIDQMNLMNYAIYSAQDYLFQTSIPGAASETFEHVMDFGAGSGRQLCLWSMHPDLKTFISVEGLPQTYGTQHAYYAHFDIDYHEFILPDAEPEVRFGERDAAVLNHLPTWQMPKIPDGSLDAIMTVQVLGELRPELFNWVIDHFMRVLRPGGRLYIRDHGDLHCPNKIDIPAYLEHAGFILEYVPYLKDMEQIHGIPKMWRKPIS